MNRKTQRMLSGLALAALAGTLPAVYAAEPMAMPAEHGAMAMPAASGGMDMQGNMATMSGMAAGDMHAGHAMHMTIPPTTRRIVPYELPQVTMMREDGKSVSIPDELNDGRPVVLSFVFTTCTEICPVISATFEQLQNKLGDDSSRIHIASVTIDPEHDTVNRLAAYAKQFDAGPEWHHYTGSFDASETMQRAFDVWHGDKMDHTPVTFLRAAPGQPWVRYDGFATSDALLGELRGMLASK